MLTSLRLVNFKNFADETLKLGPFTVIVGANASGKSNIRDAFRFLHGIGRGYTLAEIVGGKVGDGGQTVWEPLRGAPIEITRFAPTLPFDWSKFSVTIDSASEEWQASYFINVGFNQNSPEGFRVFGERLTTDSDLVYQTSDETSGSLLKLHFGDDRVNSTRVNSSQPILTQIFAHSTMFLPSGDTMPMPRGVGSFMRTLGQTRFLEFSNERMREPSVSRVTSLGDYGQNLPTVLESICADADQKYILTSWLQELTPMDVQDFEFPRDPSGRVHLRIVERNGRQISAYSASDGTLKFLAMLALLLNENPSGTYFFEDIDAGIHPNRLWLLLELIEKQTAKGNIQVITTTHSPALLGWINDTTFEHTSIVYRDENSADGIIRPVSELPNIRDLRSSQGLGRLLTSGWMEDALALAQDGDGGGEARA